jgi:hypothetical protein
VAILIQVLALFLRWREGRRIKQEIWESAQVSVLKIAPRFPPGLLLAYKNTGRRPIDVTHFRLVIELNGQEIARIDRDYGELKAGKMEDILLQSVSLLPPSQVLEPGRKVTYRILAFPLNKKPLPEIVGEFVLE